MMNRHIQIGAVLLAGLVSVSALGADAGRDAANRCAQMLGERERLACFDRTFPAGPETAALAQSRAAAPAVSPPAAAPAAPAPAAPGGLSLKAATPAPVAATGTTGVFGDEQVRRKDQATRKAEAAAQQQTLTATVTTLKETRPGVWRIALDNGQTWQQMDMSMQFTPSVGDTVQIERKMMGGYSLGLAGGKKSPWVRVARTE
jgi:hypothetical protein